MDLKILFHFLKFIVLIIFIISPGNVGGVGRILDSSSQVLAKEASLLGFDGWQLILLEFYHSVLISINYRSLIKGFHFI